MKNKKPFFFKKIITIIICGFILFLIYKSYLSYPQRFRVNQCIKQSKINEIYRVASPAHRDLSFKDHWFFGPMIIEVQVHKPNPNTNRNIGDKMIFEQADEDIVEIFCP